MTTKNGKTTALAEREDLHDLPVAEQKKFVETALRTNLDKLTPQQQQGILIAFGRHTDLRPELGEVMIYQGRIYVTVAGRIRNAHRSALFIGAVPRPASDMEKRNGGYAADDIVWICDVYRRGCPHPFRGWGKVTAQEVRDANKFTPQHKHPVEMARKRAKYDGLRDAFPLAEILSDTAMHFIAEAEAEIRAKQFPPHAEIETDVPYGEADEEVPFEDEPKAIAAVEAEQITFPEDEA